MTHRYPPLRGIGYQYVRQCAGLQAGGEGGRTPAGSGGRVLLLDVLAQDRGAARRTPGTW